MSKIKLNNSEENSHLKNIVRWKLSKQINFITIRFHLVLILIISASFGFLLSKILAKVGLTLMVVRYPISVLFSYIVFVYSFYLWILWISKETEKIMADQNSIKYLSNRPDLLKGRTDYLWKNKTEKVKISDYFDFDIPSDEGAVLWILFSILFPIIIIVFILIFNAPFFVVEFLAEIIVTTIIYKKLFDINLDSALKSIVSNTWKYFLIIGINLGLLGFVLQLIFKNIVTLGDIFKN